MQVITKPSALWVLPFNELTVIVISAAGFGGTHRYSICYTMAVTKHTIEGLKTRVVLPEIK